MKRYRKPGALGEAEINLTPLIDICFVILIMFIVVAPLLEIERIDLASIPATQAPAPLHSDSKSPITIHVQADDTILLNQEPIQTTGLHAALSHMKRQYPEAIPHLFHDRKATFGTYHAVKHTAEEVGFSEIYLFLQPE